MNKKLISLISMVLIFTSLFNISTINASSILQNQQEPTEKQKLVASAVAAVISTGQTAFVLYKRQNIMNQANAVNNSILAPFGRMSLFGYEISVEQGTKIINGIAVGSIICTAFMYLEAYKAYREYKAKNSQY